MFNENIINCFKLQVFKNCVFSKLEITLGPHVSTISHKLISVANVYSSPFISLISCDKFPVGGKCIITSPEKF